MSSESDGSIASWVQTIGYRSSFSGVADLFAGATAEIGLMLGGFLARAQAQPREEMLAKRAQIKSLRIGEKLELFEGFYVERKDDKSLVTTADFRADEIVREHLGKLVFDFDDGSPGHRPPIISEEDFEMHRLSSMAGVGLNKRPFILVDPLDVTTAYIKMTTGASSAEAGHFSTNLALVVDGIPFIGVLSIYAKGVDIYTDGDEARLRRHRDLGNCRVEDGEVGLPAASHEDVDPNNFHLRVSISSRPGVEEIVRERLASVYPDIGVSKDGGTLRILRLVQGEAAHVAHSGEGMKWWDVGASIAICLSLGYSVFIPEDKEMPSIYDTEASLPELYFGPRSILQNVGLKEVFSPEQHQAILRRYGERTNGTNHSAATGF